MGAVVDVVHNSIRKLFLNNIAVRSGALPQYTIPQIKQFVEAGGSVVTVGSSTSMAAQLGVPIADYLTEMSSDGHEHSLPSEKFYIPGSLMRVTLDNTNPVAYGMPATADVDFDSSPSFPNRAGSRRESKSCRVVRGSTNAR